MRIYSYVEFIWDEQVQQYKETYSEYIDYEGEIVECKGDSGGDVRYAPYLEDAHALFLGIVQDSRRTAIINSPYAGYVPISINSAFLGAKLISEFPSLYDMFGKFMAGLDVEALWDQTIESTLNISAINDLVQAEDALLEDLIESNTLPKFQVGMRDINAVMSSSYVIGKAMMADAKVKSLAKFSAGIKTQLVPVAADMWKTHLEWNKSTVMNYAEIMKLYFSAKMDVEEVNQAAEAKDVLWPFTVLEFERAALGALGGSAASGGVAGPSTGQKAIGGALSGAAMGAQVSGGNPYAIAAGAVIGLASAYL